jgi:hypothetical protein
MTQAALFKDGKTRTGIVIPLDALRRAWGLPSNATKAEIAAALHSRDALPESQRKRAAKAAAATVTKLPSSKPAPTRAPATSSVESHEDFMRRVFPGAASVLGYAPQGVESLGQGFGQGYSVGASGPRSPATPAKTVHAEERGHQALVASHFPELNRGPFQSRRARIESFS